MNKYQTDLYNNLYNLSKNNKAFYFTDSEINGHHFRIFLYRIASYEDFCKKGALESRGITFEMDGESAVRVSSLPMQKFFNINENPFTQNLDHTEYDIAMVKEDGSLISSMIIDNKLHLKSKGSLTSTQATDALKWLNCVDQKELKNKIKEITISNKTVNMEWVSPLNRIVVPYQKPSLIILNIRNNLDGTYVSRDELESLDFKDVLVKKDETYEGKTLEQLRAYDGIEGWVVQQGDILFKVKTNWYVTRHNAKNSINSPRRLFDICLSGTADDVRQLFDGDDDALSRIHLMEHITKENFNNAVNTVVNFCEENKHLSFKEFAIKCTKELGDYFPIAMNAHRSKYTYKEIESSVKNHLTKYKDKYLSGYIANI